MVYDQGYGVILDSVVHWKKDANKILMSMAPEEIKKDFEEYKNNLKEAGELGEDFDDTESIFDDFVDNYENDIYLWSGLEGLLTDIININDCGGNNTFRYDDCCLYVSARIPINKEERDKMLTQEDIVRIIGKYLTKLTDDTIKFTMVQISE